MKRIEISNAIFLIDEFIDPAECEALVQRAEQRGFEPAPIITATGTRIDTETRDNDRHVFEDSTLAESLWLRARGLMPTEMSGRKAVGLNERFRLYRYRPGQRFKWHSDAPFHRPNGEISLLTFIVYLNAGYEGGATRFEDVRVVGELGQALVFAHGLVHEGAEVSKGIKYALRSDVMYGPR
ncbi:iron-regulated protein [Variovorax sp. RKNM96]|uniref:2OG-Fe(II) oxygenase n=1 Tax=Variovorax sp. RKNM96 TaxID=2681552 RepID=UPI001981D302|nr:2OG-Fe(II) oxygenase [Variovorax sp. RKNM96]QSI31793.1 iron-regulated protein [Variovorax sp. RKNM96]